MKHWRLWPIQQIDSRDNQYPSILKKLKNYPEKLYYRGEWQDGLFNKVMAVVGSRKVSRFGEEAVDRLVPEVVANHITIVSGFMYGVDTLAHQKCLEYGGKTIAVLGSGLDRPTPKSNDSLYTAILESGGLVISEYKADTEARKWTFPQRNRIVAAMANEGILIIEAGINSGSLITADWGNRLGKRIMAVSGLMGSDFFAGSSQLIKSGLAEIITDPQDLFGQPKLKQTDWLDELAKEETALVEEVKKGNLLLDNLALSLNWSFEKVARVVSALTLNNVIEENNGSVRLKVRSPVGHRSGVAGHKVNGIKQDSRK